MGVCAIIDAMQAIDLAVIVIYLAAMARTGLSFMRRNRDADAYFKAGGRLPWWVVALSIYATMFSSITCISVPAMSFARHAVDLSARD